MVRLQSCCRTLGRRRIGRAVRPRIRLRGCMRLVLLGVLLPFCFSGGWGCGILRPCVAVD